MRLIRNILIVLAEIALIALFLIYLAPTDGKWSIKPGSLPWVPTCTFIKD